MVYESYSELKNLAEINYTQNRNKTNDQKKYNVMQIDWKH